LRFQTLQEWIAQNAKTTHSSQDYAGGQMTKGRLEAFSDGVIAIITIMVLEMKVPHGDSIKELGPLLPVFLSYVLSFLYVGITCYMP
jgi:uncharacterized membrane protein